MIVSGKYSNWRGRQRTQNTIWMWLKGNKWSHPQTDRHVNTIRAFLCCWRFVNISNVETLLFVYNLSCHKVLRSLDESHGWNSCQTWVTNLSAMSLSAVFKRHLKDSILKTSDVSDFSTLDLSLKTWDKRTYKTMTWSSSVRPAPDDQPKPFSVIRFQFVTIWQFFKVWIAETH